MLCLDWLLASGPQTQPVDRHAVCAEMVLFSVCLAIDMYAHNHSINAFQLMMKYGISKVVCPACPWYLL